MANTTRQENSREQSARATEGPVREAIRRDEASGNGQGQRGQDRERTLETGREVGTNGRTSADGGTSAARRGGLGQGAGFSPSTASGSPFALMSRMMDDMDRLFADFGFEPAFERSALPSLGARAGRDQSLARRTGQPQNGLASGSWMPAMEVFTRGNELVARADLPGMKREDISLEIVDDHLVIQGERRSDRETRGEGFFHSERRYGSFVRSIPLPEGTDGESIQARFADGVLEVTVPLPKQEERRKRVEIR